MNSLEQNKLKLIGLFEKLEHAILLEKNIIACEQRCKTADKIKNPIKQCDKPNIIKK
jgi:hypothetical protein